MTNIEKIEKLKIIQNTLENTIKDIEELIYPDEFIEYCDDINLVINDVYTKISKLELNLIKN